MYLTIPEIVLPAVAIIGTAGIMVYLAWRDKRDAVDDLSEECDFSVWLSGRVIELKDEIVDLREELDEAKELVDEIGKLATGFCSDYLLALDVLEAIERRDLSAKNRKQEGAPAGDAQSPQSQSSS